MTDGARIESGPVAFGPDWPGLFLRGDDALNYALQIDHVLQAMDLIIAHNAEPVEAEAFLAVHLLRKLQTKLRSVDVSDPVHQARQLRPALECLASTPTLRGPGPEDTGDVEVEIG